MSLSQFVVLHRSSRDERDRKGDRSRDDRKSERSRKDEDKKRSRDRSPDRKDRKDREREISRDRDRCVCLMLTARFSRRATSITECCD